MPLDPNRSVRSQPLDDDADLLSGGVAPVDVDVHPAARGEDRSAEPGNGDSGALEMREHLSARRTSILTGRSRDLTSDADRGARAAVNDHQPGDPHSAMRHATRRHLGPKVQYVARAGA